jgi:carotenoid 9,10(9',10')-cleavage dioxygenase 1
VGPGPYVRSGRGRPDAPDPRIRKAELESGLCWKAEQIWLSHRRGSGRLHGQGVLKYDLVAEREVGYFDYGELFGGEALLIPKAEAKEEEDDGYLVELLMSDTKAEFLILDAKTMTELARLHLPQRVPLGVHGCWLNEEMLDQPIL